MFVIPVSFSKYHKEMLVHCKGMIEYRNGDVAINPMQNKLIGALRTATEDGLDSLKIDETVHDDCLDAFRLSLMFWH